MKTPKERRQSSRERRQVARQAGRRRRLKKKISWTAGLLLLAIGLLSGGIFLAGALDSEESASSASDGPKVGHRTGNQIPEFGLRLVDGSTVNSTELTAANRPAFYFFFATW